jgi:hypothetical protein
VRKSASGTLTDRDLGPDRKAAEMSDSDDAGYAADGSVAKAAGSRVPPGEPVSFADRRRQHAWVPGSAALLTMLIGLSDIIPIFKPDWSHRLHKFNYLVPGTLTNVARTTDVIIGLALLLLAHGLRRRKRRAWQAVAALLAFDIAIHFFHALRIATALVALVGLIALLYFRDEFYAEGDQRNRWRALWAFGGLVVADIVIGLTYILLARGLAADYSFSERVWEVITGLVGVSGPVQWVPEARGSTSSPARSGFSLSSPPRTCSCARPSPEPGSARQTPPGYGNCWPSTETGTRSATSRCGMTRALSGRRPARPASATGWYPG